MHSLQCRQEHVDAKIEQVGPTCVMTAVCATYSVLKVDTVVITPMSASTMTMASNITMENLPSHPLTHCCVFQLYLPMEVAQRADAHTHTP